MSDEIEVFLNKVDAFAHGLSETEQAMLAHRVQDDPDDDVAGFGHLAPWSVRTIASARSRHPLSASPPFGHRGFISPAAGRARG